MFLVLPTVARDKSQLWGAVYIHMGIHSPILDVFRVMHPQGCYIGSSGCGHAAAVSQLMAMGLPTLGCIEHLCLLVRVNMALHAYSYVHPR